MKTNTPKLRFKEFTDEWQEKKLGDIIRINQGLQIAISNRHTAKIPRSYFYITNEFLKKGSKKQYYISNPPKSVIVTRDDLLMTRTGNTGIVVTGVEGAFHNNFFKIQRDEDQISKGFLYYFLTLMKVRNLILRLAGTSTIPDLNHSDFYKIPINMPSIKEQRKIADFLGAVDEKIEKLEEKKKGFEKYKKGVMQAVFSQRIRFKDKNGKNYPDWEEKKLGELLNYEQPTKYIVRSTEYSNDFDTPVLTAGKSFILGYTNEIDNIFQELPVIIFDDFTTASQFVNFPFKVKSSAMKILKAKEKEYIRFIFEAIQKIKYEVGGHGRHWISVFANMKIKIPSPEEQEKIAEFLTTLDDKINLINNQLEQTKLFKKSLLQRMFA